MKVVFSFLLVCFTLLSADEVQRIESILNDISTLRNDYSRVQSHLVEMEVKLEEEKEQNKLLHQDLTLYSNYTQKELEYKDKILSLENKINTLEKSLKIKEKDKVVCKTKPPKIIKTIVYVKKDLGNQTSDDNEFPQLLMKEQFKSIKSDTGAHAYRVKKEATIYSKIDGLNIEVWEKSTSFTSNTRTQEWIKITGYFIEKIWTPSKKEMWIKSSDADMRKN